MANGNGSDSAARLDRIEGLLEVLVNEHIQFADEHKRLLTAQVVLTGRMEELAQSQLRADARMEQLADAQRHADERMNALIGVVDGLIDKGKGKS